MRLKGLKNSDDAFKELKIDNSMHLNFTCQEPTKSCFMNECSACSDSKRVKNLQQLVRCCSNEVEWSQWIKCSKNVSTEVDHVKTYCNIEKVKKKGSIDDILHALYEDVPNFLDHQFIKMNQAETASKMIADSMKDDASCAVLLCDFAEKFQCFQQNAPQSAHYGQTPVSLFTAAVYHRYSIPIVIASDYEKHTKDSVIAYIDSILETLPDTVKNLNIWTDNATSQFKNQYIMAALKVFEERWDIKIRWNFYAPMHGKSIVDGHGGSVKRFVRARILADSNLLVKNAEDFANTAATMKIQVKLMRQSQIEDRNADIGLIEIVKNARKIPNIKQHHSFSVQELQVGRKRTFKVVGTKIS